MINELEKLIGKAKVSTDVEAYATDMSLMPSGLADAVVYPETTEEVSAVVKYAYENNIPVVPVSSQPGTHQYGATIPREGGIVIDMKNMNKILEIDVKHKCVRFQPGVTWKQMYDALDAEGARIMMPFAANASRSVLSDTLDRAVITNTTYDYGEVTQSLEIVYGDGSVFRSGSASVHGFMEGGTLAGGNATPSRGADPSGPGLDFYRLVQGAQGTMGIITWMQTKLELKSKMDKILLAPVEDLDYAQLFLYKIMPRRIGQEIVLLNNVDLACVLGESQEEIAELCAKLPTWTLALVLSGVARRPEEKIAYEEKFIVDTINNTFKDMSLKPALPGFPGLGRKLLNILKTPWEGPSWKTKAFGAYEDVFFIARPERAQEYVEIVQEIVKGYTYPHTMVGAYIQPIEHNRACQVEFTFFYDPANEAEKAEIGALAFEVANELLKNDAQFTRPYGAIVPVVYDRAGNYTATLKRLKGIFDEKNILNPGKLCF